MTYFKKIMEEIGVNEGNNLISLTNEDAEFPVPKVTERKIWSETKNGDIQILYYTIDRKVYNYTQIGNGKMSAVNGKPREWVQIRLQNPTDDGRKYKNPYNQSAHPFFHPILCDLYEKGEEIDTVFLTEGAKKGWVGCENGLYVIGLPSISVYRNEEKTGLHQELIKFFNKCKPKNIVILWDGDCRNISENGLLVGKPLTDRPVGFYANARNLRKALVSMPKEEGYFPNIYFSAINSNYYEDEPKGLDDFLTAANQRCDGEKVVSWLKSCRKSKAFHFFNITRGIKDLKKWFGLNDVHTFYSMHEEIISDLPFFFFDDYCQWQEGTGDKEGQVKVLTYGWTNDSFWIGDEFFKKIVEPGVRNRQRLVKYSKDTMQKLHGKNFHTYLPFYSGFCNVPSHFNYQQDIEIGDNLFFNTYFPFQHIPEPGKWENIEYFLKHIFGEEIRTHAVTGEKVSSFEMGLDYLQLMLMKPTRRLPVICLFSQENRTGKSTFGNFQVMLFGDNAVKVGNNDLNSDFNDIFAGKLLAYCEETLLERKKEADRIKDWSTAPQINVNTKNQRQYTIDFFTKFQFYSNNRRMIYVTAHDDRYWVRKVPQFKKEIPDLEERMRKEIPAFVDFLMKRKYATKDEGRMWMHPSLYMTQELKEMVKVNEPGDVSIIRDGIREMFEDFPDTKIIEMPLSNIKSEFFSGKTTDKWIIELLTDHLQVFQEHINGKVIYRRGSYQKMVYVEHDDGYYRISTIKTKGRHYIFKREDFIKEEIDYSLQEIIDDFEPDPKDVKKLPVSESDELPF